MLHLSPFDLHTLWYIPGPHCDPNSEPARLGSRQEARKLPGTTPIDHIHTGCVESNMLLLGRAGHQRLAKSLDMPCHFSTSCSHEDIAFPDKFELN